MRLPLKIIKPFLAVAILFSVNSLLAKETKYKDLGTYGNMYDIKEKNLYQLLSEESKKINKEQILEAARESVKEQFKVSSSLTNCIVTQDRMMNPSVVLEWDIDLQDAGVFIPKGTIFNPLENALYPGYILFMDTTDKAQVFLAQKLYKQTKGSMIIIVTNGNLYDIKTISNEIYKYDTSIQDTFKPTCVPSVYVQQKDQFLIREFALQKRDNKDENNLLGTQK